MAAGTAAGRPLVALTFGAGKAIYFSPSYDAGQTFAPPVKVAEAGVLPLSRHRGPRIVLTECVRCDDCERLYEDTKKCPHHLIIIRKADIMARRSVRATAPAAP